MRYRYDEAVVVRLIRQAVSYHEIAARCGITVAVAQGVARRHGLLNQAKRRVARVLEWEPTAAEIESVAASIRTRWNEDEEERRRVGWSQTRWSPPGIQYGA